MTKLARDVLATDPQIHVDAPWEGEYRYPWRIVIDEEVMWVRGGMHGTTWVVDRGLGGPASSHSAGAVVNRAYVLYGKAANAGMSGVGAGSDGKSAYQIARDHGYGGTETQWLATLVGERGPQGERGLQGEVGVKGDTGEAGPQGDPGEQGEIGPAGEEGPAGPQGEAGPMGPQGVKGDQGLQGPIGPDGPQGQRGEQGIQGPDGGQGLKGDKGDKGDQGVAGEQGQRGTPGQDGAAGQQGIQGIQGVKGDQGIQGVKGDQGLPGTDASLPSGVIVMWGGLLANIPAGWWLCNGLNGTPDLRDRFIKGAANGQNPGTSGGAATHTHADHAALSHSGAAVADHTVTQPTAAGEAAHTHTYTQVPNHVHVENINTATTGGVVGFPALKDTSTSGSEATGLSTANPTGGVATGTTAAGASHTHAMSGAAVSAHSVTQPSQHAAQSHAAGSNEPAYYALAFIQKA